jgi:hypothetical protein
MRRTGPHHCLLNEDAWRAALVLVCQNKSRDFLEMSSYAGEAHLDNGVS